MKVLLILAFGGAAAAEWRSNKGFNCYSGYGATDIDTYPVSYACPVRKADCVADCQAKCDGAPDCTAITVELGAGSDSVNCWRRKNVHLQNCQTGTKFDTWLKNTPAPPSPPPAPTPPTPASAFPTTQPQFIKAFIEGLLSDNGADAKKCEGDFGSFKSAVGDLVQTTVGATKAVAAAVEEAKESCTVVAAEAEKLALNALQDLFHPQRISQNFAATRKDVLDDFGQALVMLAKKDFRDAGDKVGMAARRIVEGVQGLNALPGATANITQTSSTSNTVASIAIFAVVHWGAATMSQSNMQSATVANWGDFLEGVLEGLMSDGSDLSNCVGKISAVREALEVAKEHVGKSLAATIAAAKEAKRSCGVVAKETEKLAVAAFNDIKHPDEVVQHFKDTQFDILMELGTAFQALARNDYATAGTLMGMSIRRTFEGKQAQTVIV